MAKQSVKKNYIYNVIYQMLVIILPVITTPYLSRILGAENIGIYSYTLSITTYFILFGSLGVAMYGQREIAYVQSDTNKRSKIFWEIIIIRCITLFISLFIFYIFFCTKGQFNYYYKILLLEIIANMIDISWFFQGLEEFKKTVMRNTAVKIISVLCIFIFIKSQSDLYMYFIIYVLSTFLGNISLWIYLPKYIKKCNLKELKIIRHIKATIALFIPQIAVQVYTLLDKTMLGVLCNDMTSVGFYEQSQKIIKTALVLVTALGTVVAPRIASIISKGNKEEVNKYLEKSYHFVWMIGTPLTFGLIATAKTLVPWFLGEEFIPAIEIIMIGSVLIMAIGLNNVSGMQYLIPVKKQNLFTKSVIIAACINFMLNYILIPIYGAIGAITASVFAEIVIIFIQAFDIRKDINIKIIYKNSMNYIIGSIIMFLPIYVMGIYMKENVLSTIIQIISGILIYSIYLLIIKDSIIYECKDRIIKKYGGDRNEY